MTLFAPGDPRPIHFMGIGGAGMSGLALLARPQGVVITGCDTDPAGAADLAALGVRIWRGHDPRHVDGARAVVVTAAVAQEQPELERARALGIPVVRRADALGQVVAGGTVVAVAGTHGKTTTTVMVTEALAAAGRDPTGLAGGRVARWGGNARVGGRELFVVEADEYDRAFLSLAPSIAVVNNVEADHLECYDGSVAALEQAFAQFAGGARRVIAGGGDPGAQRGVTAVRAPVWRVGGRADADAAGTELWRGERGARRPAGCAAPGGGVSAAPVLANGAARRCPRPGACRRGRGGGGADLRGPRAAAPGRDRGAGSARRGAGRRDHGRAARAGDAHGAGGRKGGGGRRRVHLGGGRYHAGGTGAAGASRDGEGGVTRRWPRWRQRALLGVAGSALLVPCWLGAPLVLRRLPMFRVRQIELVGVRNLAPDAVIAALRLGPRASGFGDTRLLADRVRGLAGVAEARVVRRLPTVLSVVLREVEPAALVAAPRGSGRGLVAVDAAGRPLPFDPARSGLDLPIVASGDSGVVAVLALIQSVDPALFQTITGARRFARGGVLVEIGPHRVLLGRDAGPEVKRAVVLVAQDLAAKGRAYVELDARFGGQVVVRRRATASGGGEAA